MKFLIFVTLTVFGNEPGCYNLESLYTGEYTEEGCVSWDEQTGYPEMNNLNYGSNCRYVNFDIVS